MPETPTFAPAEREARGGDPLRSLFWDAAFATAVGSLNSGVVLVAYALYFGASNQVIGLLAAIPLLTQLLQAPAVVLVERIRRRRLISIAALFVARLALPLMAVLSLIPSAAVALTLLIVAETVHCALNAVAACSWNSWIRDLVPEERLGRFFARRTVWATAISLVGSVAAAFALEHAGDGGPSPAFIALYGVGFAAGLASTWHLSRVPEPPMQPVDQKLNIRRLLRAPLRDRNFRRLILFLASWQFAVNAATPFFTVYFVQRLGISIGFVMALSVASQLANIVVLRAWGRITDRFSNKTALGLAAPIFLGCIASMVFASQIEARLPLLAFLLALHVVMGAATAGLGVASGAMTMKLAPKGAATAYVAASSLLGAAAAGVAPIIGGAFADFFAARQLGLQLTWQDPSGLHELLTFRLSHWDFYFLISAVLGVYALHRLSMVDEHGEIERARLVEELSLRVREGVRNVSPVAGLRAIVAFPGGALLQFNQRRQAFKQQWGDATKANVVWRNGSPDA
jgi:MFS family permease